MNTTPEPSRSRPWGLIALLLSVLAWGALLLGVLAFAASFRPPGDGNNGVQAVQYWMLGALVTLVLSFAGSLGAMVMAWRRRRGAVCAAIAGALLVLLVSLVMIVIGSSWG
ncbi:hypothetical protein AB9L18_12930 [Stenotrophomonas lactitubi]|uniref:hypothetical protein n=1 Tax=Stenotrophomonas lactitubi TaxID=2045214 RepID=UPI0035C1001F